MKKKENYDLSDKCDYMPWGWHMIKKRLASWNVGSLLSDKRNASEKRMILQDDFGIQMEMDLESEVTDVGHVLDDVAQRNYEKGVCEFGFFN